VIDGVAEPGDAVHRDKHPIGIDDAGNGIGDAAEREAGQQDNPRADTVDHESDRRLQQAGHDVEKGYRQRQLGIADAKIAAHESEQRRQHEHVIMAHHMRGADAGNQPRLGRAQRAD
jgi:hypothetical protein